MLDAARQKDEASLLQVKGSIPTSKGEGSLKHIEQFVLALVGVVLWLLALLRDREPERPSSDLLARPLTERRKELERDYLARLFIELGGDMGRMMEDLGVRSTKLYDWMRDLGLDIRELRKRLRK